MKTDEIPIIDAHYHLWDLSLKKHPWLLEEAKKDYLGDISPLRKSYLMADYLADSKDFNIAKTVHIQAGWEKSDFLGECLWLDEVYKQFGFPNAAVAYADLSNASVSVEAMLAKLAALPHVKGIRQILSWHENPFYRGCDKDLIDIDLWKKNFKLLKKYDLSFDMQIYPEQVDAVLPIISDSEHTPIVINHALMPTQRDSEYLNYWRAQLKKLSALPNVVIKISGVGMFDHAWTVDSLKTIVIPVIETFSPGRCMFGSNFPVEGLYGSYGRLVLAYQEVMGGYSVEERREVFFGVAEGVYGV